MVDFLNWGKISLPVAIFSWKGVLVVGGEDRRERMVGREGIRSKYIYIHVYIFFVSTKTNHLASELPKVGSK